MNDPSDLGGRDPDIGVRYGGMLGFVVVGMVMKVRGRASRDWDDRLVGYTAEVSLGEHDQALQKASTCGRAEGAKDLNMPTGNMVQWIR